MRIAILFAATVFSFGATSPVVAGDLAKPKLLPAREEKLWVGAVMSHKTFDGATVLQVLQYTEKLRPEKFKFVVSGVGYNGATGEPDYVVINYWLGAKRLPDDEYVDLGYEVKRVGPNLIVSMPGNPDAPEVETTGKALEAGRDSFLLYIDKSYEESCIDPETKAKLC